MAPIGIDYGDLSPLSDLLSGLSGKQLDFVLETPGGSGEVAEDIIRIIRAKFEHVAIIVPGYAKSAGTIMALSGNEILMDQRSSLGPIDAQFSRQGKVLSAHAILEDFRKIKDEVDQTGALNKAYIPILQGISPGELQHAQNALDFAKSLVKEWLVTYKFADWTHHSSTGMPVTRKEKKLRAGRIAKCLCNHNKWLTHGKSIKIADLQEIGLRICDFNLSPELADAIHRYFVLLQLTFDKGNVYKLCETAHSYIFKNIGPRVQEQIPTTSKKGRIVEIQVVCPSCGHEARVQANLDSKSPLKEGRTPFPTNNQLSCVNCGSQIDLSDARRDLEAKLGGKLV